MGKTIWELLAKCGPADGYQRETYAERDLSKMLLEIEKSIDHQKGARTPRFEDQQSMRAHSCERLPEDGSRGLLLEEKERRLHVVE